MGSYLSLRGIRPDLILSSCSLRAQKTADGLAEMTEYEGRIHYLSELYRVMPETMLNVLALQDDQHDSIMLIGHNPELSELADRLSEDHIGKVPALGIVALTFDIDSWDTLEENGITGKTEFFIFPKQFRYYMPHQIRTTLDQLRR
jgi:phosphohistidine phosphatase